MLPKLRKLSRACEVIARTILLRAGSGRSHRPVVKVQLVTGPPFWRAFFIYAGALARSRAFELGFQCRILEVGEGARASMNVPELLKMVLQVPELSTVGSPQERAAFIALHLEGRTVREAGQAIGISKSNVKNLADLFQTKLSKKMREMRKKRGTTWSAEYQRVFTELSEILLDEDWEGGYKIGHFDPNGFSQEDWAEVRGGSGPKFDDE